MNALEILKEKIALFLPHSEEKPFSGLLRLTESARLKVPETNDPHKIHDLWNHIIPNRQPPLSFGRIVLIKQDEIEDEKRFILIRFQANVLLVDPKCEEWFNTFLDHLRLSSDNIVSYGFSSITLDKTDDSLCQIAILFECDNPSTHQLSELS